MIVYNTYSDLLVSLYKHVSSIIPLDINSANVTFNIGNITFQLNEKTAQYELPAVIVNFQTAQPYLDQPQQFQNVSKSHAFEQLAIYNETLDFSINCYFSFRLVNIEIIINFESQLSAIESNEALINRYPLGKKLHQFEFTHFINIDKSIIDSNYINPSTDRIHNLYFKHSPELGKNNYYFMNTSRPLIAMISSDMDISDINSETFSLRTNFEALYQVPVKLSFPNLRSDPFATYSQLVDQIGSSSGNISGSGNSSSGDTGSGNTNNSNTNTDPNFTSGGTGSSSGGSGIGNNDSTNNNGNSLIDGLYNNSSNNNEPGISSNNNASTTGTNSSGTSGIGNGTTLNDGTNNIADIITLLGGDGGLGDGSNNIGFDLQAESSVRVSRSAKSIPLKPVIMLFIHDSIKGEIFDVLLPIFNTTSATSTVVERKVIGAYNNTEINFGTMRYSVRRVIDEYFSSTELSNTLLVKVNLYIIKTFSDNLSVTTIEIKSNVLTGSNELISITDTEVVCWFTGTIYNISISRELTFKLVSTISLNNIDIQSVQFFPVDPIFSLLKHTYTNVRNVYNPNVDVNKLASRIILKEYKPKIVYYSILLVENTDHAWLTLNEQDETQLSFKNHIVHLDNSINLDPVEIAPDLNNVGFVTTNFEIDTPGINVSSPTDYTLKYTLYDIGNIENIQIIPNTNPDPITIDFINIFDNTDSSNNSQVNKLKINDTVLNTDVEIDFNGYIDIPNIELFSISFEYNAKHYTIDINKNSSGILSEFNYVLQRKGALVYGIYSDINFIYDSNLNVGVIEHISIILKESDQGTVLMKFGIFDTQQYVSEYRHIINDYNAVYQQITNDYKITIQVVEVYALGIYQTYQWIFQFLDERADPPKIVEYRSNEQDDIVMDLANSTIDENLVFNVSRETYFKLFSSVSLANPAIFILVK